MPVLVPAVLDVETLRGIYERLDAMLLPGGEDVNPARYDAAMHPMVKVVDDLRDTAELALARWSVEDDRPVFGICRGIQVMNVALGGTLVQDIPSVIHTDLSHDIESGQPRSTLLHTVSVDADSRLASILGQTELMVNSLHHQAIEQPASAFRVIAHAPDGIPEAVEIPDAHFAMAVQWHPEDMEADGPMRHLFAAFVDAARARMKA